MNTALIPAAAAVRHYLAQIGKMLDRVATQDDPEAALTARAAPDMFNAGTQIAVAIRFAARALLPLAGRDVPAAPAATDIATLRGYAVQVAAMLDDPDPATFTVTDVSHRAGFADLEQGAEDYLLRYALPNMIFHMTAAYTILRLAGVPLGKADFDGQHQYPAGFSF